MSVSAPKVVWKNAPYAQPMGPNKANVGELAYRVISMRFYTRDLVQFWSPGTEDEKMIVCVAALDMMECAAQWGTPPPLPR